MNLAYHAQNEKSDTFLALDGERIDWIGVIFSSSTAIPDSVILTTNFFI